MPKEKTETEHYTRPELNAEVSMGLDGNFSAVLSGPSCYDPEKIREALQILRDMPADRRAVWLKRLDLRGTMDRCPLIKDDPKVSKEFEDLVSAYKGPGAT
jgi:hypothetical protein